MGLLGWAMTFLVVAIVAGLLGFTNVATGAAVMARTLFGIFLAIFVILLALVFFGIGSVVTGH